MTTYRSSFVFDSEQWEAKKAAKRAAIDQQLEHIEHLMGEELKAVLSTDTCGHPTKKGKPCRQPSYGTSGGFMGRACGLHDGGNSSRILEALLDLAYSLGRQDGIDRSKCSREHVVPSPEVIKPPPTTRTHNSSGEQLVEVDGLTYHWSSKKDPLALGDRVQLPQPYWADRSWDLPTGIVTSLESSYVGSTVGVIRKLAPVSEEDCPATM